MLVFDQAMDASSLTAAFTISPTVEGELHFPNAETLEFRPAQPWIEGRYEVRLPGAVSAAGTPLAEDWELRYGVGGRNLRAFRTSADREAALLQQILAPALRSRNAQRRKEALEALENLAVVTTHLKHLLLIRDLRKIAR